MSMVNPIFNITQPSETRAFTQVTVNNQSHLESPSFTSILVNTMGGLVNTMDGLVNTIDRKLASNQASSSAMLNRDFSLEMFGLKSMPAHITQLSEQAKQQMFPAFSLPAPPVSAFDLKKDSDLKSLPIAMNPSLPENRAQATPNTQPILNLYTTNMPAPPHSMNKGEFYIDTKNMDSLKYSGDNEASLRQASAQFEALFVQQMLKGMRTATAAIADEDNPLSQIKKDDPFQDMLDNKMAISMTNNGGIGLADMIYKQLSKINR